MEADQNCWNKQQEKYDKIKQAFCYNGAKAACCGYTYLLT